MVVVDKSLSPATNIEPSSDFDRDKVRAAVIEGCVYMKDVSQEIEREFNHIDEELHRAVEYGTLESFRTEPH